MRKRFLICLAMALAASCLWSSVSSQPLPLRPFPKLTPSPEYDAAMKRIANSYRKDGKERLLVVARDNPNTTLGAMSLFKAAYYSDTKPEIIDIYNRIISEYPQSRFEIQARQGLVAMQATSPAQWLDAATTLVTGYGAPGAGEILQNPLRAGDKFRALPLEYQRAVIQYYASAAPNLFTQKRYDDSFALALFGMDVIGSVDPSSYTSFANVADINWVQLNGQNYGPFPPLDPEVRLLRPRPSRNSGPRPRIYMEARQRGASQLISLGDATFQLDGQNVKAEVRVVKHKVNLNIKARRDLFERLRLVYRPAQNLSEGQHLFIATIPVRSSQGLGKGTARLEVRLNVRGSRDTDEDNENCDEDEWDDRW